MLYNKTATHKIMTTKGITSLPVHPCLKGGPYDRQIDEENGKKDGTYIDDGQLTLFEIDAWVHLKIPPMPISTPTQNE